MKNTLKKLIEAIRTFIEIRKFDRLCRELDQQPNTDFFFEIGEARDEYRPVPPCCAIMDR